MERIDEGKIKGGKRRLIKKTRRSRVIGDDELREGIDFLPVPQMLRLSDTGFIFLREFMRHRGKGAMIGKLRGVNLSALLGVTLPKVGLEGRYYFRQIPPAFISPPDEVMSIGDLNICVDVNFSQRLIDLVRHFSSFIGNHWLRTSVGENYFSEEIWSLLGEFQCFRGISIWSTAFYKRLLNLPCIQRTQCLIVKREISLNSEFFDSLVDWLHFTSDPSIIKKAEEKKTSEMPQKRNERTAKINGFPRNITSFWNVLKQRFLVDSTSRCFTVRFPRYSSMNPEVLTCSERNEKLCLSFHNDFIFIRRFPIGSDFISRLDDLPSMNDYSRSVNISIRRPYP